MGMNHKAAAFVDKLGVLRKLNIIYFGVVKQELLIKTVCQKLCAVSAELPAQKDIEAYFIAPALSVLIALTEKMDFNVPWKSPVNSGVSAEKVIGYKTAGISAGLEVFNLLCSR